MELEEDVKIYLEDNYERINVPVPQFGGGDPADIIHDFQRVRPARGWGGGRERVSRGPRAPLPPRVMGRNRHGCRVLLSLGHLLSIYPVMSPVCRRCLQFSFLSRF